MPDDVAMNTGERHDLAEVTAEVGSSLAVEVTEEQSVPVVRLAGELDIASVATAHAALNTITRTGSGGIVFDVGGVTFMDSSGIAFLLHALARFGAVRLRDPSDLIREVIAVTGLAGTLVAE